MPRITVIIPSYNHALFISEAITSVLNQTFQDFEIIIFDDASSDNSVEIISSFNDPRIKFLSHEQNMGACYTANRMIELASGEYIALLNSDDIWELEKLSKQIEFMDENKQYGAVFSNAQIINEYGSSFENKEHFYATIFEQPNRSRFEWLNYFFNVGNCLCHPSILIRKSVYDDVGLYNPLMASLPDFEMWVRVCLKYEIYVMPEKLVQFRILDNEQNASGMNPAHIIRCEFEHEKLLDQFSKLSEIEYEQVFGEPTVFNTEYSLACKSITKPNRFMQSWGINTIYRLLNENSEYMKPNELTKLTGMYDIFNIYNKPDYFIQLFLDQGNGISEENSIKFPVAQNTEIQEFIFDLSNKVNITNLRLDPLNDSCVIEIEELKIIYSDGSELELTSRIRANDLMHHGKSYFFDSYDPIIHFGKLSSKELAGAVQVVATIRYAHIARNALEACTNQTKTELEQTKTELEQIYLTLAWRITLSLKKIKQIVRKN